jgi:hypothetical protein
MAASKAKIIVSRDSRRKARLNYLKSKKESRAESRKESSRQEL